MRHRLPDLIDDPPKFRLTPASQKRIDQLRPLAHRFKFDEKASREVGKFLCDCEDLVIENRQFAIPPFPVTYIEMHQQLFMEGFGRPKQINDNDPDERIGFVVDRNHVYVLSASKGGSAGLLPVEYRLNTPAKPLFHDNDRFKRGLLLLGTTYSEIDEAARDEVIDNVEIIGPDARTIESFVKGAAGDIRSLWAFLLVLNQPQRVTLTRVPPSKGIVHGKRHVYAAHSTVTINVGPKESYKKAFGLRLRTAPRRHDVRGHFVHRYLAEGCVHKWSEEPDEMTNEVPRWYCQHCHGMRIWRQSFERGDAGVGFKTKDYAVNV